MDDIYVEEARETKRRRAKVLRQEERCNERGICGDSVLDVGEIEPLS